MKRAIPIGVGLLILILLYWRIDVGEMWRTLASADLPWLLGGTTLLVPLVLAAAVRLQRLVPSDTDISLAEVTRLILAASALNIVLPSKMGDLAKSWFFRQRGHLSGSLALALVLFERSCDALGLFAWCAAGLAMLPRRDDAALAVVLFIAPAVVLATAALASARFGEFIFSVLGRMAPKAAARINAFRDAWQVMHTYFWAHKARVVEIAFESLIIWFLNLFQVWTFARALGVYIPVMECMGLAPLAIVVGLLPVSFAGIGTRDLATIYFFRNYLDTPTGAALGLLLTGRYVLLGLAGLPFLGAASRPPEP